MGQEVAEQSIGNWAGLVGMRASDDGRSDGVGMRAWVLGWDCWMGDGGDGLDWLR